MTRLRLTALLAVLALCGTASVAMAAPSARCAQVRKDFPAYAGKELSIALTTGYPVLASQVSSGPHGWTGFVPDMVEALSSCLGFTYSFGAIDFGGLVPAIQQHRFDLSVPDAYLTPPRLAVVRFVAYISAAERVVVPQGNPKGIKTTSDLCGLTATSQPGAADVLILQHLNEQCSAAGKPAIVIQNYSMGSQDFQAVSDGHADFHIDGESVYSGFNGAHPGILQIVLDPFAGIDQGMVFPQDSTDLIKAILAATRAVQEDGIQGQLIKKWKMQGVIQKDAYIAPALP